MKKFHFNSSLLYTKYINLNADNFLNNDFRKIRLLLIETTLRTLPFTKVSLKSSGSFISEKIRTFALVSYSEKRLEHENYFIYIGND